MNSSHDNSRSVEAKTPTENSSGEAPKLPPKRVKVRHPEPSYISPISVRAHPSRVVEPLAVEVAEYIERQESPNFSRVVLENPEGTRAQISRRFDQFWTSSAHSLEYVEPETHTYLNSLEELDTETQAYLKAEIENQAERIILIRAREAVEIQLSPKPGGYPERKLKLRGPKPR